MGILLELIGDFKPNSDRDLSASECHCRWIENEARSGQAVEGSDQRSNHCVPRK